ncbi:hypothetical protein CR513_35742, partial [Mucuna pruriens]
MLDQFHRTAAQISLLTLLINSKSHWELLLKILNEAHVPQDITPTKFGGIINNITVSRLLSFSKEEVPTEVKCGQYMIARVLIDNGSSLNIMPKSTLDKLYAPGAILRNSSVVVRAFDGSKREVIITLPILIGPTTFDITFQVMDIWPAYSCLLGRPWIHAAGALISVMGEREMMVSMPFSTEYIEEDEEAFETSF